MNRRITRYVDLGMIAYGEALQLQQQIRQRLIEKKQRQEDTTGAHLLILCQHPPVLTFGSSADDRELLVSKQQWQSMGVELFTVRRGGAITFHGPGQIVGYPVLDLEHFSTDVRWYIRNLAEVIIRTLADYGLNACYDGTYPGVWLDDPSTGGRNKIAAIGVHLSRWVSNHGFAFNVSNSTDYYRYFIPCGIDQAGRGITTLERELGYKVSLAEVQQKILQHFTTVFDTSLAYEGRAALINENTHEQLFYSARSGQLGT